MILLRLFWEFFKTGLFAVGGGMATLPFLYDMSARTGWFTQARLADMIAVSESTPGPIGVNMATYVGFETAGIPGAVLCDPIDGSPRGSSVPAILPARILEWVAVSFLEKGKAIHSSILAWRILWTEEPGGLESIVLHRVRYD